MAATTEEKNPPPENPETDEKDAPEPGKEVAVRPKMEAKSFRAIIPDDAKWDDLVVLGRGVENISKFVLGDIVSFVASTARYGEKKIPELAASWGKDASTLRHYQRVSELTRNADGQPVLRGTHHPWSVYKEFAGLRDWAKLISRKERWTAAEARELVVRRELESDRRRQKKDAEDRKANALARLEDILDTSRRLTFDGEMAEAEETAWRDRFREAVEEGHGGSDAKHWAENSVREMRRDAARENPETSGSAEEDYDYEPSEAEVTADKAAALIYERRSQQMAAVAEEIRAWPQPDGDMDYDDIFIVGNGWRADDVAEFAVSLHYVAVTLYATPSLRRGYQGKFSEFADPDADAVEITEKALGEAVQPK